ncbi:MAG: lysoplasmalogenase [Anaerolineales bacterium]|nr:lysoplasmalogenase [Anaerolineales bacterium]
MKTTLVLIPVLAGLVFFLVRAEFHKKQRAIYFLKPLSTLTVIAVACLSFLEPMQNLTYAVGVIVGLLFCFGGDIALMFQEKRKAFMLGLILFLLGHIAYAIVFGLLGRFSAWDILSTIVLLITGIGFYRVIKSNLGALRVPVIVYIVVISVMVSRALSTFASPVFTNAQAWLIVSGAILFYISDLILAAARFWKPWRYHRISLAFYYSGQLLIALAANYFM